ncbi:MAG TPA: hypothetical protein DC005_03145, partial [Proteobacteria bacterium]|nr:hypothetical protein [Pseudomonadota bacterium]
DQPPPLQGAAARHATPRDSTRPPLAEDARQPTTITAAVPRPAVSPSSSPTPSTAPEPPMAIVYALHLLAAIVWVG